MPIKVCSEVFKKFVLVSNLGLSQQELQVSSAQDAVVLHVAGQVDCAGAVDCAVNFHVGVNNV